MTNEQYVKALAQELEDTIVKEGSDTVAGFFFEPVVGAVSSSFHGYASKRHIGTLNCACRHRGVFQPFLVISKP